jgi:hypothetical protein
MMSTSSSSLLSTHYLMEGEGGGQVKRLGGVPEPSVAYSRSPVVHSCPLLAPHVSSTVRIASLAMTDLWAELKCRHSGEDGRVTIECQWERRHCQGHNLDGDFDVVDTAPVGKAAHTPTPPVGSGGGCMMLAPHLRMVVWPRKFRPRLPEKYDWSVNPIKFM